ncbi:phosphotransferase [Streptomyces meridianus]|uniref:Aminoglycoside phosphotransferase family protein n=1 Tax=Streptomyces meridianus TaxID=2938945 RepID=A0ABT0XC86_9ACTN|nr:aminoglycoside phosphotransferase family protein [Streptomyces meridianus]MCM2580134.1 aminoglycoside phosphotransferase family protein [Streptomyces meridianus]
MHEEILTGGGVNHVVRIGATVRRPTGPWTPAVHALLDHLAAAGFRGAPRAHGIDEQGREVLDFVPGQIGTLSGCDGARPGAAGRLLRAFHDATAGFVPPAGAIWYFPPHEPAEVVCHGDAAPYNMVFRDGLPVAFIDFDTAHPGPRIRDVAYAAYRFVPLTTAPAEGAMPLAEQARRLRLFADAYGLAARDRATLVATAVARLEHLVGHMEEQAAAGNAAFARHLAEGHDRHYRADAEHLARHADVLTAALGPAG